jgi:hypothetical protein
VVLGDVLVLACSSYRRSAPNPRGTRQSSCETSGSALSP